MAIPLFVYGTLKRSGPVEARSLLANAKLISTGSIAGTLYDLGDYPGVVRNPGDTRVFGELYEFEDENANRALALLDRYDMRGLNLSDGERWRH